MGCGAQGVCGCLKDLLSEKIGFASEYFVADVVNFASAEQLRHGVRVLEEDEAVPLYLVGGKPFKVYPEIFNLAEGDQISF